MRPASRLARATCTCSPLPPRSASPGGRARVEARSGRHGCLGRQGGRTVPKRPFPGPRISPCACHAIKRDGYAGGETGKGHAVTQEEGIESIARRSHVMGSRATESVLAGVLALMSDAAVLFDDAGRIALANDAAEHLFVHGSGSGSLVGTDVRAIFPPAVGVAPRTPFHLSELPFTVDGQRNALTCLGRDGTSVDFDIRCEHLSTGAFLLVAHVADALQAAQAEHDRLVGELSRANQRLAGTLGIVLDTLGAQDIPTLFGHVLEEITQTMEATGTILYVVGREGYHLRGRSSSLEGAPVSPYVPLGRSVETLSVRVGTTLRLRVLAPHRDDLRQGSVAYRDVVDEATRETHRVRAATLPPFTSLMVVPIWFGGHVIALLEVGWERVHPLRREDAELLDAVAQYLSVQLAGALQTMRTRRETHLDSVASSIREKLMEEEGTSERNVLSCLAHACEELGGTTLQPLVEGEDGLLSADLSELGVVRVDGALLGEAAEAPAVMFAEPGSPLGGQVDVPDMPTALVDLGVLWGARRAFLLARPRGSEPFMEVERTFLGTVAHDIHELVLGGEAQRQNKHIAQALQTGMRNELQQVDGITAQGIYSSATATAVIGGDFYDLIRLPDRRACVIMGDVSGKGVEAASVSAAVKTALGAYAWQGLSPAQMVRLLNEFLLGFSRVETFATLFVGIIDLNEATLAYCSAGHPPALLVRGDSGELEGLDVQSGVVGAFHDMAYRDGRMSLRPGDVLLLYTDGTTEARSPSGAFLGEDGLRDAVMTQGPQGFDGLLDRLLATLDDFTGRNLDDDVAMVALRFDGVRG